MQPYLIGIAGPSGAGKSVLCRSIQTRFENVSRLKLDDFFKDIEEVPRYKDWIHWDQPESLHWEDLVQAVQDLKTGKHAIVPNYSRKDDRRVGEKCVFPAPIILVDGFMTLCDERVRDLLDLSLFLTLSEESQVKRRKLRQPWVEEGYLHEIMLPAARECIMPSSNFADYIIDAEPKIDEVFAATCNHLETTVPGLLKNLETSSNFRCEKISQLVVT